MRPAPASSQTPPSADAPADGRVTPMMAQYLAIKTEHPDALLFYRMGDFYELFFADAEAAAKTLGIVLTRRGKHLGEDIPMCGVPTERAEGALARLIAAGHRVAICEQTEDPAEARRRGGKALVRREVVRVVTPGTVTEEGLLEPGRANLLVALARRRAERGFAYGLAALDLSTGRFSVSEVEEKSLAAELARLEPSEIALPEALARDEALRASLECGRAALTPLAGEGFDPASAERRLLGFYEVATLDAFGAFTPVEIAAAGTALAIVERTQLGAKPALPTPAREAVSRTLAMDPATRASLEITRTLAGERQGSLVASIDLTLTPGGARLLAERLAGPLTDPAGIAARLDGVERLVHDSGLREALRTTLKGGPDLLRALSRLELERGGPRDLASLAGGLERAERLAARLQAAGELPAELAAAEQELAAAGPELRPALERTLADELPLHARDGGFVREGVDPALDEARLLQQDARRVIVALQARYAAETGCRTLRIKHNHMLGYFVEVPAASGEEWLRGPERERFIHRQTMAEAMRFTSAELAALQEKIASAAGRALALEAEHFRSLSAKARAAGPALRRVAEALAALDVAAALAEVASRGGWARPRVDQSLAFRVSGGRHPVVEAALAQAGQPFIANDCDLSGEEAGRLALITGPNMGGKSTYLRQNAIIALLAQAGSFVPAAAAHIGVVDRLFSRVGAADDLARGRSTFMVEMVETAAILNQATRRSLVILDEIGRGTSTFDGLSLAWAAAEHLHDVNRSRGLFATHFYELTSLAERLPRLSLATLRVAEWKGEVVFLHEVVPGVADRSYGLQVARLAGLPSKVLQRAKAVLGELERSDRERPRRGLSLDELPLFAAARPAEPPVDRLREALAALDPDALTPRAALEELYRLKAFAGRG